MQWKGEYVETDLDFRYKETEINNLIEKKDFKNIKEVFLLSVLEDCFLNTNMLEQK